MRKLRALITLVAGLAAVATLTTPAVHADAAGLTNAPESTYFSTVSIDPGATVGAPAIGDNKEHGDLWPSCWSNDDNVYGAYGDGLGFGDTWHDIGAARISGMETRPPSISAALRITSGLAFP